MKDLVRELALNTLFKKIIWRAFQSKKGIISKTIRFCSDNCTAAKHAIFLSTELDFFTVYLFGTVEEIRGTLKQEISWLWVSKEKRERYNSTKKDQFTNYTLNSWFYKLPQLSKTYSFMSCKKMNQFHSVSSVFKSYLKRECLLPNARNKQILSTFCLFTVCFTSLGKTEQPVWTSIGRWGFFGKIEAWYFLFLLEYFVFRLPDSADMLYP